MSRDLPTLRPGPAGGKREENRRKKAAAIRAAGVKLFLKNGIDAVTIDDIVQEAGVAKGSFYRYYEDAGDLVESIFAPMLAQFEAAWKACAEALKHEPADAAYKLLAGQLGMAIFSDTSVALLYLQECRGPATGARAPIRRIANRVSEKSIELTKVAHERGLLRPFDGRVSALAVVGAVERLLFGALSGEDVGNPETVAPSLISLIMDGMRPK